MGGASAIATGPHRGHVQGPLGKWVAGLSNACAVLQRGSPGLMRFPAARCRRRAPGAIELRPRLALQLAPGRMPPLRAGAAGPTSERKNTRTYSSAKATSVPQPSPNELAGSLRVRLASEHDYEAHRKVGRAARGDEARQRGAGLGWAHARAAAYVAPGAASPHAHALADMRGAASRARARQRRELRTRAHVREAVGSLPAAR